MKCLSILIKSSLLAILCLNFALAEDVIKLNKGDSAPFQGLLFPEDKAKETYNKLTDCNLQLQLLDIQDKKVALFVENENIYKSRIEYLRTDNEKLMQKNADLQQSSDIMKAVFFLGGALLTTAIVFGVNHVQR